MRTAAAVAASLGLTALAACSATAPVAVSAPAATSTATSTPTPTPAAAPSPAIPLTTVTTEKAAPTTSKKSTAKATPKPTTKPKLTTKPKAKTKACDADGDVSDCDAKTQAKYRSQQEFNKCPNSWNTYYQRCQTTAERKATELDEAGNPGEAALVSCQEQTGLTRKQCQQQAKDGLAS